MQSATDAGSSRAPIVAAGMVRDWFEDQAFRAYYHRRSDQEAAAFIDRILPAVGACAGDWALDACCGGGRHSAALAARGLHVIGVDFSDAQLALARTRSNAMIQFVQCEIEKLTIANRFDLAFNLHTSLGFGSEQSNLATLRVIHQHLKPQGKFVLDYWNSSHPKYEPLFRGKSVSRARRSCGIAFATTASITDNVYRKHISVTQEDGTRSDFVEQTMVISENGFGNYFQASGFRVLDTFGNHELAPFDPERSERLIFITEKI